MDAILDEQQALLRDSAARLCAEVGGPGRARALRYAEEDMDHDAWRRICGTGWPSILIPEESGGLGLGLFDLSLVLEESGKQLLMVPLLQACVAALALARSGDRATLADVLAGTRLAVPVLADEENGYNAGATHPVAIKDGAGYRLDGTVRFVPFALSADTFLVAARVGGGELLLAAVARNREGLRVKTAANVDGSTSSDLFFDHVAVQGAKVLAHGETARERVAMMQSVLVLGTSAELVGLADAALDMTLEYLKFRKQFGKPLGSFQALQHRAVNGYIDIELNRSLVYRVFSAWDAGQRHPAMVSALKARTSRSALEVTRAALQMHGAIGYTDEHDIGLYYKRAVVLAALYGNDNNHASRFSRLTLNEAGPNA